MAKKKDDDAAEGDGEEKKGGKMKLIIMLLPTVLLVLGAVYFLVLAPSGEDTATKTGTTAEQSSDGEGEAAAAEGDGEASAEASPTSTYVAGKIVTTDAISVNLAGGHFLKVGLALQATADAGEEVTGAKALDAAITEFSGKTVDELATADGREAARKELLKAIKKAYEKKVYEVFFTTYVMQ